MMRFRWTLVLFASAAFSAGCSPFGSLSDYDRLRQEQDGFSEIVKDAGGTAELEGQILGGLQGYGWTVDLSKAEITDGLVEDIIEACKQDPIFILKLGGSTITDEQMAQLDEGKVLQKVFILDLGDTKVTDAGLDQLDAVYAIAELNLKGSQATAAGAARLGKRKIGSPQTPASLKKEPKVAL